MGQPLELVFWFNSSVTFECYIDYHFFRFDGLFVYWKWGVGRRWLVVRRPRWKPWS